MVEVVGVTGDRPASPTLKRILADLLSERIIFIVAVITSLNFLMSIMTWGPKQLPENMASTIGGGLLTALGLMVQGSFRTDRTDRLNAQTISTLATSAAPSPTVTTTVTSTGDENAVNTNGGNDRVPSAISSLTLGGTGGRVGGDTGNATAPAPWPFGE
jgi:hypothetical protein